MTYVVGKKFRTGETRWVIKIFYSLRGCRGMSAVGEGSLQNVLADAIEAFLQLKQRCGVEKSCVRSYR